MVYKLLQNILETSAENYPTKIAIEDSAGSITYQSLLYQSNGLANILLDQGIKSEDIVGIFLDKSINMIASFFGVLLSGGTYIPLDTYYSPIERIKIILLKSNMKFIITDTKNLATISSITNSNMIIINIDKFDFSHTNSQIKNPINIRRVFSSENNAYILFTSGSTGIPKGVMISHTNALVFINWAISYFSPTTKDIFANFSPFTFDLSVFDIFVSIACGSKLCLIPTRLTNNPKGILIWLAEKSITYIYTVPSVWVNILNYTNSSSIALPQIKKVLFAGEVFPKKHLVNLMAYIPEASFYNLYGPTETNVCTCYQLKSTDMLNNEPIPIGNPCKNTFVIALDENNNEIKVGQIGELFVKGPIVSKGYYNDPENTNKSFVKLNFNNQEDTYYKTGDIVKKIGYDLYQYLERKDYMVKISGFRIEIGEIETALLNNNAIQEATVFTYNEANNRNILCAAIKIKSGKSISIMDTKKYLSNIIPRYMIPELIFQVSYIPKNPHGKIDRAKLHCLINSCE